MRPKLLHGCLCIVWEREAGTPDFSRLCQPGCTGKARRSPGAHLPAISPPTCTHFKAPTLLLCHVLLLGPPPPGCATNAQRHGNLVGGHACVTAARKRSAHVQAQGRWSGERPGLQTFVWWAQRAQSPSAELSPVHPPSPPLPFPVPPLLSPDLPWQSSCTEGGWAEHGPPGTWRTSAAPLRPPAAGCHRSPLALAGAAEPLPGLAASLLTASCHLGLLGAWVGCVEC